MERKDIGSVNVFFLLGVGKRVAHGRVSLLCQGKDSGRRYTIMPHHGVYI